MQDAWLRVLGLEQEESVPGERGDMLSQVLGEEMEGREGLGNGHIARTMVYKTRKVP